MNPEDELIAKLKIAIGKQLPDVFREMAEKMLEQNKDVIIHWLKENKQLVNEVIKS